MRLTYGHQALCLSVRDDGVGIVAPLIGDEGAMHFGLVGMRERAERVGGRIEVTSREGQGTEVIMVAPARIAYKRRWLWPFQYRSTDRSEQTT